MTGEMRFCCPARCRIGSAVRCLSEGEGESLWGPAVARDPKRGDGTGATFR